jgi:putative membrane protein
MDDGDAPGLRASDHLANERTYLAWVRTGIAVIALGFVVARFGVFLKAVIPSAPQGSNLATSVVGIALVLAGGLIQFLALFRFLRNQERIKDGRYEPGTGLEFVISAATLLVAIILVVYLLLTV